jgi:hypothetical protein
MAFEAFLTQKQDHARPTRWRRATVVLSLGLHGALLVAAAVYSFWRVDEVTPPAVTVTFLSGARVAPPPPPPAPPPVQQEPPKPKATVARPQQPKIAALVQPRTPTNDKPPPPSEEPAAESDEHGAQEGAPGGELGGTGVAAVATVAPPPPPPPPKPVEQQPVNLPPGVGTGQRITDINDPRFRPSLPPTFSRAGAMFWGLFRICVGADGNVKDVKVVKSADPSVDADWSRVIRTWQYRPFTIENRPVPFCHVIRLEVRGGG